MAAGFLAAFTGDWFLAIQGSPTRSVGFLYGVLCFLAAHLFWTAGQLREARPDGRVWLAVALPLAFFVGVRVFPVLPRPTAYAILAYSCMSAFSFAVALATRRACYAWGVGLLLFSDLMIGFRMIRTPGCGMLVGPCYVAAELCLLASFFWTGEKRFDPAKRNLFSRTLLYGCAAFACLLTAACCYPGGYDPCVARFGALGYTVVRGVEYPWSHSFFLAGMLLATVGAARVWAHYAVSVPRLAWGGALHVAGLAMLALIPLNAHPSLHSVGAALAVVGCVAVLLAVNRQGRARMWSILLSIGMVGVMGCLWFANGKSFAWTKWLPLVQKLLIVLFTVWMVSLAYRVRNGRPSRTVMAVTVCWCAWMLALVFLCLRAPRVATGASAPQVERAPATNPLCEEERHALRWLERVTGKLPPAEEKEWWDIGGSQHGLFAKRYHIAFCGYAAALLGMRGDDSERARAGRILGNCITRYLRKDVWAYSMSKNYWGRKPWAPDPCYRENVMYTGHLLQLLALYETFTGDKRYWTEGFDFVWDARRTVHYDVRKLIDVTVEQMRNGPNGGITCEPGLMFFPCNNHPHIALALFSRLGYGNWESDARRWEKWALSHYANPLFGGGQLNLVYHVRSGIFYPRGHGGLDGWSLLWYEPWAENRETALALWRQVTARLDWEALSRPPDFQRNTQTCCDPVDVPPVATLSFLAPAARACDDTETAERLEALMTPYLKRDGDDYYLDVGREWRVGATANYIMAVAERHGSRFRDLVRRLCRQRGSGAADAAS